MREALSTMPEPSEMNPVAPGEPSINGASSTSAMPADRPAQVIPVLVLLSLIDPDPAFRLREEKDLAGLATSIARMGQLVPIDLRLRPGNGHMQVLTGFRRLGALQMLQRERVLARVHHGMSDAGALTFALAQGLEQRSLSEEEIGALRDRLDQEGRLSNQARGLIEAALTAPGSDLGPEEHGHHAEEEVDLDVLAGDITARLSGVSADLALVSELWTALEPAQRDALLDQLRYCGELHAYLSGLR